MQDVYIIVGILGGVVVLIAAWAKGWPHVRRFMARMNGTFDAVVGRDAYTDPASGKEVEALPPLTTRVAHVETAIVEFRHMIGLTTETLKRVDQLEQRVKTLEDVRLERMVNQAESAQMWRAVAENGDREDDADDDRP